MKYDKAVFVRGSVGSINLGNSCYFNTAMQCLFATEDLSKYFIQEYHVKEAEGRDGGINGKTVNIYNSLIQQIWMNKNDQAL